MVEHLSSEQKVAGSSPALVNFKLAFVAATSLDRIRVLRVDVGPLSSVVGAIAAGISCNGLVLATCNRIYGLA